MTQVGLHVCLYVSIIRTTVFDFLCVLCRGSDWSRCRGASMKNWGLNSISIFSPASNLKGRPLV